MATQEHQSIQNLLTQVSLISKKYEEIAKHTGENYNIFQILGATSDELAHSRIIGDLLNPKGVHGLGDVFLKEFLSILDIKDFETQHARLEIEKHIGFTNDDYSEGGRIDLFLSNRNNEIVIENKIYARDQNKQLERYHNAHLNARIIYLTLDGNDASDQSLGVLKRKNIAIINISYQEHIIKWLEESLKYSINYPLIRETIRQYINLIKHLTGQTRNEDMSQDIINLLISNPDNLISANNLVVNIKKTKIHIVQNVFKLQIESLANELNLEVVRYDAKLGFEDDNVIDLKRISDKKYNLKITIYFENTDFRNVFIGVSDHNIDVETRIHYFNLVKEELPNYKQILSWIIHEKSCENWNVNTFVEILKGEYIQNVRSKVKNILDAFDKANI